MVNFSKRLQRVQRKLQAVKLLGSGVLIIFSCLFSFYHLYYGRRIIPGIKIGTVAVGGLTQSEANKVLQQTFLESSQALVLKNGSYSHTLFADDIDLVFDWDASIDKAFKVGRSGNFFVDLKSKVSGLFGTMEIPLVYYFEETLLTQQLFEVYTASVQPSQEARFVLNGDSLDIVPAIGGRVPDVETLYSTVMAAFAAGSFSSIEIPIGNDIPAISTQSLAHVRDDIAHIVFSPLSIVHEDFQLQLTPQQKLDLINIADVASGLSFTLKEAAFEDLVSTVAAAVHKLPRGSVTTSSSGKVLTFEIISKGRELDKAVFKQDLAEALFAASTPVPLVFKETGSPEDASKYGINTLLGQGVSRYTGSSSGRIHNLTLAAERTNGILVPPGQVYSFNDSVGEISSTTGYDPSYIILKGRTVLGEGGGVCQTSTTLFRAVLNAGLPIVSRHPHAYRVFYYELDSPVGFDASIYQPSVDFRFKNDTTQHVLIQASWDLAAQTLTFSLYGTPDGRQVEISEPLVTNVSPPPEPRYQDDPTLPVGVVKQVDFAAGGATVSFDRKVSRNGTIIHTDTFTSSYRPWQAVFLVGTKS